MKKNTWIIMLVVLFAGVSLVNAQGMKDDMMDKEMKGSMMDGGMMGKGKMDTQMSGMCPMMQSMMQKQVVATSDGGIIVVAGNKLTKFDKDLNVVKEVELKMDMEGMQKMMDKMKNMCPMMGKMNSSMGKESAEEEKAEHEIHHLKNK